MKEIEVRAKLNKEQYDELLERLKKELPDYKVEKHLTLHSQKGDQDVRLRLFNDSYYTLTLKIGSTMGNSRKEINFSIQKDQVNSVIDFLKACGFKDFIKWERPSRHKFVKNGISIDLDEMTDFGYYIEFEKVCEDNEDEDLILKELRDMLKSYGLEEVPMESYLHEVEEYMQRNKIDLQ